MIHIPVGLLVRLVGAAVDPSDEMAELQRESEARERIFEHELANQQEMGKELWASCTGPSGCLLVLVNNDWRSTEVDGVRINAQAGGADAEVSAQAYRDPADPIGRGPHGLIAVSPGRHVVRTTVDGQAVDANISLLPGEAAFRRLDRGGRAWTRLEGEVEQRILDRLAENQLTVLNYFERVAEPRVKAMVGKRSDAALHDCMSQMNAVVTAIVAADQRAAMNAVQAATRSIIGVPIHSFAALARFVGFHTFELMKDGKANEAWLLLQAALAVVPDEPTILATLGEIQIRSGAVDEGKCTLGRALERAADLDATMRTRVGELLAS